MRGVSSKLKSLENILKSPSIDADIVALVETNLSNNKKVNISDYECFSCNRKNANMGGVAILVKDNIAKNTVKIGEGTEEKEYLITRHSNFAVPLNVIVLHGEQETRNNVEKVEENWATVMEEIQRI